jgi:hypothetical protein
VTTVDLQRPNDEDSEDKGDEGDASDYSSDDSDSDGKVHGNLAAFNFASANAKSIVRMLPDSVYDDVEDSDRDTTARASEHVKLRVV